MKPCDNILLYASGELDAGQKAEFKSHLAGCPSCGRELAFLSRMEASLIPTSAPQSVVEGLFAKTTRRKSFFAGWKPVLAGTALLGVGIFIFLAGLHPDKTAFDAKEVIAYMSENLDEEYLSFASDLEAFEQDF